MFDIYKNIENEKVYVISDAIYMYTYIETRETRERDSFFSLSSSFNILSCNLFSRLDSFLSFARFEVSRTRARRKTACVVRFLFPRASHGIVVNYTVGERGIQNETEYGAYFVRDKKVSLAGKVAVYAH